MKRLVCAACVAGTLAAGVAAQDADQEGGGFSLMEEGARQMLRGLMAEVGPALDELQTLVDELGPALQDFAMEMGPALQDILEQVEDWSAYHPPEVLENGDIIIRRKQDAPPPVTAPDGSIEL